MTANARADCPTPVPDPQTGTVEVTVAEGRNPAIASNGDGAFLLVYETNPTTGFSSHAEVKAVRLSSGGACLGSPAYLVDPHNLGNRFSERLSVAMNADGNAHVAFTTKWEGGTCAQITTSELRSLRFLFGNPLDPFTPPTTPPVALCTSGPADSEPSAAIDAVSCWSVAWSNDNRPIPDKGLVLLPCSTTTQPIRACDSGQNLCFLNRRKVCLAARPDGYIAVVWADAEFPSIPGSDMNIMLRIFDSAGSPASNEIVVNQPAESQDPNNPPLEQAETSQESPAVAFDSAGRLVVVWFGPNLPECGNANEARIFVRQFSWSPGHDPARVCPEFVAESDYQHFNLDGAGPNPTVAFSPVAGQEGRYVVMWNTARRDPAGAAEVHARIFDWRTLTHGNEFSIHSAASGTPRRLGQSAQHSCAWTPQGNITATWTEVGAPQTVNVTIFPSGFPETICHSEPCCRGDFDGNGIVYGADEQYWVYYLINPPGTPIAPCRNIETVPCKLDLNGDCRWIPSHYVAGSDSDAYVCLLLWFPYCWNCTMLGEMNCCAEPPGIPAGITSNGMAEMVRLPDCNGNGVEDSVDVASGASSDCNQNGWPDECDVGLDPRITDFNRNLVPDECEPQFAAQAAAPPQDLSDADRTAIAEAMNQWLAGFDYHELKVWQLGYEIKLKFNDLGFDLRATVPQGGN